MTTVHDFIDNEIKTNDVILFMKGTPEAPQCGFQDKSFKSLTIWD